jgi:hypothetical protein
MTKEIWGNIELPGLCDEELLKKDWNKSRKHIPGWHDTQKQVGSKRKESTVWKEAMQARNASAEWKENVGVASRKRSADPTYQQNIRQAVRESNSKAIMTPEGQFEVISDACRYYFDNKLTKRSTLGSVEKWIRTLIKKPDSGFYLIGDDENDSTIQQ